jgi:hypothetical protein
MPAGVEESARLELAVLDFTHLDLDVVAITRE